MRILINFVGFIDIVSMYNLAYGSRSKKKVKVDFAISEIS